MYGAAPVTTDRRESRSPQACETWCHPLLWRVRVANHWNVTTPRHYIINAVMSWQGGYKEVTTSFGLLSDWQYGRTTHVQSKSCCTNAVIFARDLALARRDIIDCVTSAWRRWSSRVRRQRAWGNHRISYYTGSVAAMQTTASLMSACSCNPGVTAARFFRGTRCTIYLLVWMTH